MHFRVSLLACVVMAICLSGCGRRGPLEPPPGSPPAAQPAPPLAPTPHGYPGGLFRNTAGPGEEQAGKIESAAPPKKSSPFVLDPLL